MDKITIKDLEVNTQIGVTEAERAHQPALERIVADDADLIRLLRAIGDVGGVAGITPGSPSLGHRRAARAGPFAAP